MPVEWKSGKNLTDADLRFANLGSADLRYADLRGADLRYANLEGANLRGADLRRADLRYAKLRYADLTHADFDFSAWPLWCGSLDVKGDLDLVEQLVYHTLRIDIDQSKLSDDEREVYAEYRKHASKLANLWSGIERHSLWKIG